MSECKYRPLFGRVLIERKIEEKRGSIILPDAKRHARNEGIVIATGPTCDESIQIGNKVVFGKHSGTWLDSTYSVTVEADGTPYFLCQDEDILLVIEKQKESA